MEITQATSSNTKWNRFSLTKRLEAIYRQKLALLAELKQSLLHKAFSGEL